ncbi:MAG: HAD-IA family hydrolase [Planctomycetota bacterium]|nr:HAD-IA family hydrolase [Planctomycetota bacterium]
MSVSKLRAVIFDLDGLMFNTEQLYQQVGTEILRRRGKTFDDELLDRMMGRPSRDALQIMIDWHSLADTVAILSDETDVIFADILDTQLACMPGLVELLDKLEEHGIPKAICTSSGRRFVNNVLSRFEFGPRFQFILTGEDVTHGKPNPEIYLAAVKQFGLQPHEVMVLEDSQNGCRAAIDAGTFAVAVPGGHSRRHVFTGAALQVDSLADRRIYEALRIETD